MLYNTKVIEYEDYYHIQYYMKPIQKKEEDYDIIRSDLQEDNNRMVSDDPKTSPKDKERSLAVSVNRSKNNLYRIARSNKWDYFITLTFDPKLLDSTDYDTVSKKITQFFNNVRKRGSPDLMYLLVPEFHKDGKKYHFHGLLSNCPSLIFEFSGHYDFLGEKIYNIKNWDQKIGFTTATAIRDQSRVVNYIGKYITKDLMNKLKFKKRYYCSRNVNISEERYYNIDPEQLYDLVGDNISYIKTINVDKLQKIKYIEVKKTVDIQFQL